MSSRANEENEVIRKRTKDKTFLDIRGPLKKKFFKI
jgi:hypothetical protein